MISPFRIAPGGIVHVAHAEDLRLLPRRFHAAPDDGERRRPCEAVVWADGPSSGVVGLVHRTKTKAESCREIDHVDGLVHAILLSGASRGVEAPLVGHLLHNSAAPCPQYVAVPGSADAYWRGAVAIAHRAAASHATLSNGSGGMGLSINELALTLP